MEIVARMGIFPITILRQCSTNVLMRLLSYTEYTIQDDGRTHMKQVTATEVKADLVKYLKIANREDILIIQSGKPAGILRGFSSEDECYDYLIKHDPELLQRLFGAPELEAER